MAWLFDFGSRSDELRDAPSALTVRGDGSVWLALEQRTVLTLAPGATEFNSDLTGEVRGGIAYNNKAYFVIGNTLYEFDAAGTDTAGACTDYE